MNLSSQAFIKKLKQRDSEALTLLINSYHEVLIKGALKQGLAFDQAEEVVGSTWSTFFEKVENFEGRSHIRTYLFGIMYNKVKELWRSNKKYTEDHDENYLETLFNEKGSFNQRPHSPDLWLENKEFMHILEQEIDKLPSNQKMAFVLKEVEGESTENICNILGISSTNLGVLIYRAKNRLRVRLEKRLDGGQK